MQHHAADELHVEVPHLQHAPARLAHYRKGFGKDFVQSGSQLAIFFVGILYRIYALANPLTEFVRLRPELLIAELLHLGFERVDASTSGIMRLISRSLLVPKILAMALLINSLVLAECPLNQGITRAKQRSAATLRPF